MAKQTYKKHLNKKNNKPLSNENKKECWKKNYCLQKDWQKT